MRICQPWPIHIDFLQFEGVEQSKLFVKYCLYFFQLIGYKIRLKE